MPSELQLQRALQEIQDLKRELDLLNKACPAEESANRIRQFIIDTPEALADETNSPYPNPGCCCILL